MSSDGQMYRPASDGQMYRQVSEADLTKGARVLVHWEVDGLVYRATIHKKTQSSTRNAYKVHYDGYKKNKLDSVNFSNIVALLDEEDCPIVAPPTVGDRVSVKFDNPPKWFDGNITKITEDSGQHKAFVKFDDGDEHEVEFPSPAVTLIPNGNKGDSNTSDTSPALSGSTNNDSNMNIGATDAQAGVPVDDDPDEPAATSRGLAESTNPKEGGDDYVGGCQIKGSGHANATVRVDGISKSIPTPDGLCRGKDGELYYFNVKEETPTSSMATTVATPPHATPPHATPPDATPPDASEHEPKAAATPQAATVSEQDQFSNVELLSANDTSSLDSDLAKLFQGSFAESDSMIPTPMSQNTSQPGDTETFTPGIFEQNPLARNVDPMTAIDEGSVGSTGSAGSMGSDDTTDQTGKTFVMLKDLMRGDTQRYPKRVNQRSDDCVARANDVMNRIAVKLGGTGREAESPGKYAVPSLINMKNPIKVRMESDEVSMRAQSVMSRVMASGHSNGEGKVCVVL